MDTLVYYLVRGLLGFLERLPLGAVARIGAAFGGLAYRLDGRHRRVAIQNLAASFPDFSPRAIRHLARENFRRIGEAYASAVKTASMNETEIQKIVEVRGLDRIRPDPREQPPPSRVLAIGHFGNFELFARAGIYMPGYQGATTYRGLAQPGLNRLMQEMRERSGCLFFERRHESEALKSAMKRRGLLLGLLSDQHAGNSGLRLPFFGRECSTTPAPAIFALRYHCALFTAICFRVAPGRWRIEVGEEIPTRDAEGNPFPTDRIMREVNARFEEAARRDPANWFWVHNRWKNPRRAPEA